MPHHITTPCSHRRVRRLRQVCVAALAAPTLLPALLLSGCARSGGDSSAPAASSAVSAIAASAGTTAASTTAATTAATAAVIVLPRPPAARSRSRRLRDIPSCRPPACRNKRESARPRRSPASARATPRARSRSRCRTTAPSAWRATSSPHLPFLCRRRPRERADPDADNFRDRVGEISDDTLILASVLKCGATSICGSSPLYSTTA